MQRHTLDIDTSERRTADLTPDLDAFCASLGDGLLNILAPHATAGLALLETGSGSEDDLVDALNRLLPRDDRYRHSHGAVGHGADHVLPALISPSLTLPVDRGRLVLGRWQRVVLVDLNSDNPLRQVRLTFLQG